MKNTKNRKEREKMREIEISKCKSTTRKHHKFRLIFVTITVLGKLPTIERDHNDNKIVLLEACQNFPTNEYPRKFLRK